jgi:hypothetical protein
MCRFINTVPCQKLLHHITMRLLAMAFIAFGVLVSENKIQEIGQTPIDVICMYYLKYIV